MIFDPEGMGPREVYKLITGTVVPRPIAWVSTLGPDERANLAPFSYFNGVASRPATVSVSFAHPGRSAVGLEEAMNQSAATYPAAVDEFEALGLEKATSTVVSPPGVAASKVRFECSLDREIQIGAGTGSSTLILARVLRVHVADGVVDEALHVDERMLDPVGRLAGQRYASLGEIREYERKEIDRKYQEACCFSAVTPFAVTDSSGKSGVRRSPLPTNELAPATNKLRDTTRPLALRAESYWYRFGS